MSPQQAGFLVLAAGVYLACGAGFAGIFSLFGAGRIDPKAREAGWGFRLLILPGAALLWPFLALRWLRRAKGVR